MTTDLVFSAAPVLAGLTRFQRNTVEHIIDRFYRQRDSNRFLVADETGLGKTIVARGVIARTIEELQHDDSVDRIDIVYVCSNTDLARQNLRKLNVTGDPHHGIASRLTLLAKHSRHFAPEGGARFLKPVNLVSFTPGTSFEKGWRSGKAEERAMLYLLLERRLELFGDRAQAAHQLLKGSVSSWERLRQYVSRLRDELRDDIDQNVVDAFLTAAERRPDGAPASLLDRFAELLDLQQRGELGPGSWHRVLGLVGDLRSTLARESVHLLTPDLVILDEFQRFRQLLNKQTEAGELAHSLYEYDAARTLLLSATPYKPFTYAEEAQFGEDHHKDFMTMVEFLADGSAGDPRGDIATALADYRKAVVAGEPADQVTQELRRLLLRLMTRTERPRVVGATMATESFSRLDSIPAQDLLGFVAMRDVARKVGAPFSVEYWKSAPYFANFMDGYKIAEKVREALKDPSRATGVRRLLKRTQRLDTDAIKAYEAVDLANARLRRLADETVDAGWWKLLWVPPSLPYLAPGGPYAEQFASRVTKRLVFSSWMATPSAVATLLSYESDRLSAGDSFRDKTPDERDTERKGRRGRLAFRMDRERDRPASMATLALFWPAPGSAELADPRDHRRETGAPVDASSLRQAIVDRLRPEVEPVADEDTVGLASHWFELFRRPDSFPPGLGIADMVPALAGVEDEEEPTDGNAPSQARDREPELLTNHVREAFRTRGSAQDRAITDEVLQVLADVAAHSPANVAYRSLRRISHDHPKVTPGGLWLAAAQLASSFRTLFSRPETTLLLDQLNPDAVYWRAVLAYCAWGNLQAVMDEYLHHLAVNLGSAELDDAKLMEIARAAATAVALRPARYELFNPDNPRERLTLPARFALRYGGRRQEQESNRLPVVRQAFNSPFWPLVLATTSVGQEGIDFHWWSHSLLHWNTPASPIDFEQREGRVDRYDGHAVRKNIAHRHAEAILASDDPNPWRAAYRLAQDEEANLGDFAPHWVYPGPAKIERHVSPFGLSVDESRLANIKRDVALYRLTFGQPLQEDMLELLKRRYTQSAPDTLDALRLDLSAPDWPGPDVNEEP
ncbi:DEAD/DEAH box helicase family protein [Micropruina glycogenica]|uniref:Helicase domain protein n=1 Tax=Micropruina glycogenica TaxID=75385 RepID=A0A2N9JAT2_9ACTN|nr:helicase [Micropruina glycogenica]SPD85277.1 Helicase domain protein [Micropruina glycogenica]